MEQIILQYHYMVLYLLTHDPGVEVENLRTESPRTANRSLLTIGSVVCVCLTVSAKYMFQVSVSCYLMSRYTSQTEFVSRRLSVS